MQKMIMRSMITMFLLGLSFCSSFAYPSTPVKVNIMWEYKNFNMPVEIFEVKDGALLWETKSVKSIKKTPVIKKIEGSMFALRPGSTKQFALVVKNTTDKPLFFFAAPHVATPPEHSLGMKFHCLCTNHVYKVGPKETWYRIVEFNLSRNFMDDELTVTHSIIGIDENRAKSFSEGQMPPDF